MDPGLQREGPVLSGPHVSIQISEHVGCIVEFAFVLPGDLKVSNISALSLNHLRVLSSFSESSS